MHYNNKSQLFRGFVTYLLIKEVVISQESTQLPKYCVISNNKNFGVLQIVQFKLVPRQVQQFALQPN